MSVLAATLCFGAPLALTAQEGNGPVITEISVSGLKRTRRSVPEKLLKRYIGVSVSALDTNAVIATLLDTGIFEDIRIDTRVEGEGAIMAVTVSEKWSLIPLPVFIAASEGITAGAAVIDANAFGLNDKIFAVGLFLPGGWMSSIAYVNVPANSSSLGWSSSVFFSRRQSESVDAEEEVLRRYGYDALSASFQLKLPFSGLVESSLGLALQERSVRDVEDGLREPDSGRVLGLFAGLASRRSSWDGVFLSERSAEARYTYNLGLVNSTFQALELKAAYEHPFFPGLKLVFKGALDYRPQAPAAFEENPASVGITVLPSAFSAAVLVGGSAGLEGRLVRFPFGVLAGLLSYQALYSDGPLLGERLDHGPAAGIRLYVAKVAIPAMDLGAAYNLETGLYRITFGIGMRM